MLLLFVLLFGIVGWRLVDLQVVDAEELADRGVRQRSRTIELPGRRGRVYDREGDVLVTSVDSATIYADPRAYRSGETPDGTAKPPAAHAAEVADVLAPLVGRDVADLRAALERDAHFVYVARQLDWELGQRIMDLELPGIGLLTEPKRVYPAGPLAGQILGFTGIDGAGLHGLELQHDDILHGTPGQLVMEGAPGGLSIASGARELRPPVPGTDLVLTIDREIQSAAEAAALRAIEEFDAVGASVVVLEVGTGDVLAMASEPGYDPNDVSGSVQANWRNRAVTDVFEPGSVQKALTAAAAIEEGVVSPTTPMVVDDRIQVGSKTFKDSHDHPVEHITFAEVMETSSNVGTIQVAQALGKERLDRYLRDFGYGSRLGTGFPGESHGLLMPVESWWNTSLPTIAIGQGVAVTLLQTAHAYATIANDGVATQPRILRGTVGEDGRLTPADPSPTERIISSGTSRQVREMLARVVSGERGTGKTAQVPGYAVAGKTGTARKPSADARGYSGEYVASFVGFAPVEDPKLVVAVMVDEPYPIWGGVVAAPVFQEVLEFALKHRKVPPTEPNASLADALTEAALQEALADAQLEGPATAADEPASPPVGAAAGGDGAPVAEP
ncbi:MAG: penicillin-binding protein 2 [Actinobacteria bacterium]|nr:penicillin-binding protein 2 [Actinomycetota bacterium]